MMQKHGLYAYTFILLLTLFTISCSGSSQQRELSEFELEHGIGPITEKIELESFDPELVAKGAQLFGSLCTMCHGGYDIEIAPSLDSVLQHRSPEYVMNMIMNPIGMTRWHPSRSERGKYLTSMPYQSLTTDQARAIVEYLRSESPDISL